MPAPSFASFAPSASSLAPSFASFTPFASSFAPFTASVAPVDNCSAPLFALLMPDTSSDEPLFALLSPEARLSAPLTRAFIVGGISPAESAPAIALFSEEAPPDNSPRPLSRADAPSYMLVIPV